MAGKIPQSFINDLIDRLDIVDVVESRMALKKSGKNYSGLCPFHDEKTPSFTVSPDKQFFHCFGCQESGTALTFIMKYDRLEFVEAVEMVAAQMGLEVPREGGGKPRNRVDPSLYEVLDAANGFYRQTLRTHQPAIDYLKSRGLTGEVARDFGIGYAPDEWQGVIDQLGRYKPELLVQSGLSIQNEKGRRYDRFRDRIMFPIRDTRGRIIGFGGRVMSPDQSPKYLNSPETPVFQKGNELYGLYEARRAVRQLEKLIVVEGYMDVVALAQSGVPNAVATLGTATGTAHFQKLYRYVDEVVCCFDGDQAGRQAAWRALENALPVLHEHRHLKLAFLPDGEDPDTFVRAQGKHAFSDFIANAAPALEFLLHHLAEGLDLQGVDDRAKFSGLVQPYLDRVTSPLLLNLLQQRVGEMMGQTMSRPAQPARSQGQASAPAQSKLDAVSRRLLVILLKQPQLLAQIDGQVLDGLLQESQELGLFGQVLAYLNEHAEADIEELLVYWSDHPQYPELLNAAQQTLEIDSETQKVSFIDGINRIGQMVSDRKRRQSLAALQQSPDIDQLRTYWKQRSAPGSEPD